MISDAAFFAFHRAGDANNPGLGRPNANHHEDMAPYILFLYQTALLACAPTAEPHVVEIGVDDGTSSIPLLRALEELGKGTLHSVDQQSIAVTARGIVGRYLPLARWDLHAPMDSGEYGRSVDFAIDVLLIDGDHSYAGAKSDFDVFTPHVRPGGYVFMHDCGDPGVLTPEDRPIPSADKFGVWDFLVRSRSEILGAWEMVTFGVETGVPMAILRKRP